MGSPFQEFPYLLPVLPESFVSVEFSLALGLALGALLALGLAIAPSLLPAAFPLSESIALRLALLALAVGTFRKTMTVPLSERSRLASRPTAVSTGSTSFIRFQSHRADFGQALSRSTPSSSATAASFLCSSEEVLVYSSLSSMNLMMVWATGEPSRVAWF